VAGKKHAVVIGVKEYERVPPLKFADKDARDVADALPKVGFDDVALFEDTDRRPDRPAIFAHLGGMKSSLEPDDVLLFYFSGHGMMDENKDYLLTIESSQDALAETALPVDRVVDYLRRSGSKRVIMMIDACRNELPTGKGVQGIGASTMSAVGGGNPDLAVLFSCAEYERSYEIDSPDIQQSSFTHCLLHGIKNPTVNTLGQVTDYLAREVKVLNNKHGLRPQVPYLVPQASGLEELQLFTLLVQATAALRATEDYITFFKDLYANGDVKWTLFLEVSTFLSNPVDAARQRAIHEVHSLEMSVPQFEQMWDALRGPLPPTAPENPAGGANGTPPGGP
jgi:Caspase domain